MIYLNHLNMLVKHIIKNFIINGIIFMNYMMNNGVWESWVFSPACHAGDSEGFEPLTHRQFFEIYA